MTGHVFSFCFQFVDILHMLLRYVGILHCFSYNIVTSIIVLFTFQLEKSLQL